MKLAFRKEKSAMKQFISKTIGFMLVLSIILTGIPAIQVQAASKPVISSSQVKIKKNACSVKKGKKIKLAAKYGKKDITKKGTWKSSKKSVATISKTWVWVKTMNSVASRAEEIIKSEMINV